ncbi:MAG: DEAD/DEAH box helicase [Endozoicomonas sp. (ex Botrylloides leachii)]|nr:DEAD/DEAH box helicase [Endozoicomonas sp. (ex Botrylloides leachii)]
MSFAALGLSAPLLKALKEQNYTTPSPIQSQAIPVILKRQDIMASAQTGTGKTAAFTLPILEMLSQSAKPQANMLRALVLTPTRELAAQVNESISLYAKYLSLRSIAVFGGVKVKQQMMQLDQGIDILVATPGRLLDLYSQHALAFNQLEVLVLDEADRMLDMGFIHDIKKILTLLPKKHQRLLFSATFSKDIRLLAKGLLKKPTEVSVTFRNTTADSIKQWIHPVDKKRKPELLTELVVTNQWSHVLVFTRTKHGANRLTRYLQAQGIHTAAIHGNKSQVARERALSDFKKGHTQVLVATDIAARGLDIEQLPQVINFDLPAVPENYVHRVGRTGRAGSQGQAISLVSADEFKQLSSIERLIKKILPREEMAGFEPAHNLPASHLKPLSYEKRSKQSRVEHKRRQQPKPLASSRTRQLRPTIQGLM